MDGSGAAYNKEGKQDSDESDQKKGENQVNQLVHACHSV